MTPSSDLASFGVSACANQSVTYRPWAAPWSRIEVTEGARVDDTLQPSARGCVAYRVDLVAGRNTLIGTEAVSSAHSEWMLRPSGAIGTVRVGFVLPPGFAVASAWPSAVGAWGTTLGGPDTHRSRDAPRVGALGAEAVASGASRLDASFVLPPLALELPSDVLVGHFEHSTRDVGGTQLQVARVAGTLPHTQAQLVEHIAQAVGMVGSVGGRFPSERILAVVWPAPSDQPVQFGLTKRGGGASILLFFGESAPAGSLAADWVTVHELSHLLHPLVPGADRWLSEGIATYYQEVLRARAGWQTPEQAWTRIAQGFRTGRLGGTGRTLREEALAMHETAAYTRVYWGGTAFALAADMELRARGSSLDAGIARCVREVQRTSRPVPAGRILAVFDEALVPLGAEYGDRSEWPPTDDLLERLGVRWSSADDDATVELVDAPESALRDAIMRPRR
ncbi:MAG: hypothetical protein R3B40_13625 [Polyangiales bacterium]|nr:hypothetical protein [Sandaracinaceae bacterium]